MICAGGPSFYGLGLENGHIPIFGSRLCLVWFVEPESANRECEHRFGT